MPEKIIESDIGSLGNIKSNIDIPIISNTTTNTFASKGLDPIFFLSDNNQIEEIISNRPSFLVKWGILIFLFLIIGLISLSWFVEYPDIVSTNARLNSLNAPKQVIAHTEGRLTKLFVKDGDSITANKVLGYLESLADPFAINTLNENLEKLSQLIFAGRTDEITSFFTENSSSTNSLNNEKLQNKLGELQIPYQTFIGTYITFHDYLRSGFFLKKKTMLAKDVITLQKQYEILQHQKELLSQDLTLSNESFSVNETLAKQKVISPLDLRNEKSKLISKQLSMPQINTSIISNEGAQNEKQKEIAELENQIKIQKDIFTQSLNTFKSQIQAWEYKYVLRSPISGTLSYIGFLQENQEIKMSQTLFSIQPANTEYYMEMPIPQYNFGKVKTGQIVQLRFQAYPFEQFGMVIGNIDYISQIPTDSGYLARVVLPNGLHTNYKKSLHYQNGLHAQASIITQKMRLLERFYFDMVKQWKGSR
jgi:HlyD family secretion protein